MCSTAEGTKSTCFNLAKALALFFSYFQTGIFADHWIEFNSTAQMNAYKGKTPVERWRNDRSSYVGSTNFQGVIDLFCNLSKKVPLEDFPNGIVCVSD